MFILAELRREGTGRFAAVLFLSKVLVVSVLCFLGYLG